MKNLKENMKRFNTKNLNEQSSEIKVEGPSAGEYDMLEKIDDIFEFVGEIKQRQVDLRIVVNQMYEMLKKMQNS
jgi:hypothetical protein